ncbi:protein Skeletor, isoforms B/C-like [Dermatophagoides pteronyssinus]|uniref:Protein Skeletor, isoforms B/C-like n=1 Tax=Dermatophagoides pteronyssinus TaxID=6956 RepID=A0A6P6XT14_DERPT|nr:protein Skeletor, isoforms B/C-like [Dermatophagoides pteronyssinus]
MFWQICLAISFIAVLTNAQQQEQEQFLGDLPSYDHGVSGKVYAINDRTIILRNLNYDGQAPDAFFWIGTTKKPGVTGQPIPDENGSLKPLKGYRNANITLQLPAGKTLRDIKHFGIWCRAYQIDFGHVKIN